MAWAKFKKEDIKRTERKGKQLKREKQKLEKKGREGRERRKRRVGRERQRKVGRGESANWQTVLIPVEKPLII